MSFNIKSTLIKIQSYLQSSGYFTDSVIGEPKAAPASDGLTAAVFMRDVGIASLTLNKTIEVHNIMVRCYCNMLRHPPEKIELELADVVQKVIEDLLGDFDLGATIRNIDVGGSYGSSLQTSWGYIDVSGTMFRVADIALPLIVDDSAEMVA